MTLFDRTPAWERKALSVLRYREAISGLMVRVWQDIGIPARFCCGLPIPGLFFSISPFISLSNGFQSVSANSDTVSLNAVVTSAPTANSMIPKRSLSSFANYLRSYF